MSKQQERIEKRRRIRAEQKRLKRFKAKEPDEIIEEDEPDDELDLAHIDDDEEDEYELTEEDVPPEQKEKEMAMETPMVMPGPTTWDEKENLDNAREKASELREVGWDVQDLVYNIIAHPELTPSGKAKAMKEVADGFEERVSSIMATGEEDSEKELDLLSVQAIQAYDKKHTGVLENVADIITKAKLTAKRENALSDAQFALVRNEGGVKVRKYPIHDKCLHGKTKIALLDGRNVAIEKLVGKEVWVYAFDTTQKAVVPALAKNIRKTISGGEMLEVFLDNGESVVCTPDHRFLLRSGIYRQAQDLNPGDSIMPLYRKETLLRGQKPYEQVYQPWYRQWEWTHHMSHREYYQAPLLDGNVIHHKNDDHFDNRPINLEQMTRSAHCALHGEKSGWAHVEQLKNGSLKRWEREGERERQSGVMRKENEARKRDGRASVIGKKISNAKLGPLAVNDNLVYEIWHAYMNGSSFSVLEKEYSVSRPTMQKHFARLGLPTKKEVDKINNHKVVDVKVVGDFDGYDMEVPGYNNFALTSGIFVHNSHVRNALARAAQMINRGGSAARDARAALPKIRAAAKRMGIGESAKKEANAILVEKDANGDWRWVGWVTNNFIDWDGDIFSEEAHKEYVEWLDKNMDVAPSFVTWHTPGTVRESPLDFATYEKGFLIVSGKLTEQEAAGLLKAKTETEIGLSHGAFVFGRDPKDPRIVTKYRMYEVSDLPLDRAANPFTAFETITKEVGMDKLQYLAAILGSEEKAKSFLEKTGMKQKELQEAGVESKEKTEVAPATTEEQKTSPDIQALVKQLGLDELSEWVAKTKEDLEKIPLLEAALKELSATKEEKVAEMLTPPAAARFSWLTEVRKENSEKNVVKDGDPIKDAKPGLSSGWLSEATQTTPMEVNIK